MTRIVFLLGCSGCVITITDYAPQPLGLLHVESVELTQTFVDTGAGAQSTHTHRFGDPCADSTRISAQADESGWGFQFDAWWPTGEDEVAMPTALVGDWGATHVSTPAGELRMWLGGTARREHTGPDSARIEVTDYWLCEVADVWEVEPLVLADRCEPRALAVVELEGLDSSATDTTSPAEGWFDDAGTPLCGRYQSPD